MGTSDAIVEKMIAMGAGEFLFFLKRKRASKALKYINAITIIRRQDKKQKWRFTTHSCGLLENEPHIVGALGEGNLPRNMRKE